MNETAEELTTMPIYSTVRIPPQGLQRFDVFARPRGRYDKNLGRILTEADTSMDCGNQLPTKQFKITQFVINVSIKSADDYRKIVDTMAFQFQIVDKIAALLKAADMLATEPVVTVDQWWLHAGNTRLVYDLGERPLTLQPYENFALYLTCEPLASAATLYVGFDGVLKRPC